MGCFDFAIANSNYYFKAKKIDDGWEITFTDMHNRENKYTVEMR